MKLRLALLSLAVTVSTAFAASAFAPAAFAMTVVPPGNRHAEQPEIPGASAKRTEAMKTTYEEKYRKVYGLLKNDKKLRKKIKEISAAYGIDPMHMVGAIVGEHTYNVDAYDRLQSYYVKAASYLDGAITFSFGGESIEDFVARPQFSKCGGDTYDTWICREAIWNSSFRGQTVGGKAFPNKRFSQVFFQPLYAGQTFGIAQLNPLVALQMSDIVHRVSGLPLLSERNAPQVYETIMDPDQTLPYVAATLKKSIDSYRELANVDISQNPGITATLYNVGDPEGRARALVADNKAREAAGQEPRMPEENYYGWLINEKLSELQPLF
ncbi:MAG: DUF1402 family protein [Rhizobiaceae bacterium]